VIDVIKFEHPVSQELYEIINCFNDDKSKQRLVDDGEAVFLFTVKDRDVQVMGDAKLDELQTIALLNAISQIQTRLTQYMTDMQRRG